MPQRLLIFVAILAVVASSISRPRAALIDDTVPIPAGTFTMGSAAADIAALKSRYRVGVPGAFRNETPARTVTLSAFRIDRFEVTNAAFARFLEAEPGWRKDRIAERAHNGHYLSHWKDGRHRIEDARLPVVFITWSAARSYCQWRGGRLPTEAEWEYVARGGDDREFPWGNELPSPHRANYFASEHGKPVDVGSYPPNDFGVHDLAGNVWEFLLDDWAPEYDATALRDPVAGGRQANEPGVSADARRAVRGASFGGSVVNLRTRWRDSHVVSNATAFVGFRCAYPQ